MMRGWQKLSLGLALIAGAAQAADMTVLRYVEQDPGDPPYVTRLLVTPAFMRMDSGEDAGDFVLLDRRKKTVYNVMLGSGMAMAFVPGRLPARPSGWRARLETRPGAAGTLNYRLLVNQSVCSEGKLAPRAAPDVARALGELKSVLAVTQYRVWQASPRDMQHECDLANQVWEFGRVLKAGLPLEEVEAGGRVRQFESESRLPLDPALFRLPEGLPVLEADS
jgi:hypothetical protein